MSEEITEVGPKSSRPAMPIWLVRALLEDRAAVLAAAVTFGVRIDKPMLGQESALAALREECSKSIAPFQAGDLPAFRPPVPGLTYQRRKGNE